MSFNRCTRVSGALFLAVGLTLACGEPTASPREASFEPRFGKGKGGGGGPGGGTIDLEFRQDRPEDIVASPLQTSLDGENTDERIFTNSDGGDVFTLTYTIPTGDPCLMNSDLNLVQLFNGQQVTATGYRVIADKQPDRHGRWEHVSRVAVNLDGLSNPIDPSDQDTYKIQFVGYNSVFDPVTDVAFTETTTSTIVTVDNQNVQVDRRGTKGNDTERDTCQVVASYTFEASKP